jgi:NADH-quinone oxidoreductase subunit A
MSSSNLDVYMPVLILMSFGILMVAGTLIVGKILRPNNPNKVKLSAYECGEEPVGDAWTNFNVRFYVIALVFIIFDVESALMFPLVSVFKQFNDIGEGGLVLVIFLLFVSVLLEGLIYCWKKGDLDWVKSYVTAKDVKETNSQTKLKESA